ncbi:TPA: phage tail protein [Citrobacter freundii]|nr:phage tail protein [Citrobacter freundii]
MTAKYLAILTNQGAARLANAAALGTKLNLTQMAVGDANGTLPTPDPAQTKLINQKRIAPLNLLTVDPANTSQIIAEQIIPENEGGFWIREIGLYDDDGILIAVANCPETYKPQLQEGSGRTQTIRMILIVSSTSSITLKIDPSVVLATRKYADDKAIELKLYVDDLMSKHLAAADPHSQYATKDSPTFTGKPKAPTPPVVANDTQVATAGFVQAVIAALVSGELANKQPLDKTLTDLSGKDVAAILEYLGFTKVGRDIIAGGTTSDVLAYLGVPDLLKGKQDADNTLTALARLAGAANKLPYFSGPDVMSMTDFSDIGRAIIAASTKSSVLSYLELGSAAKKNTGTDADQIPDMSSFAFGSRWITLPSGHIIQFDVLTAGVGDKANWPVTNYPIPFPNELLLPPVAIHTGNGAVDTSVNFIVDTEASLTRFRAGTSGLTPQNGAYIAIGR